MNAREIKLVGVALLFTGLGGGVYWYLYLRGDAPGSSAAEKPKIEMVKTPPPATINLGLMQAEIGGGDMVNLFNYRKEVLVATAAPEPPPLMQAAIPAPPVVPPPPRTTNATAQNTQPAEAPVVNIPLAYSGFARDANDEMVAFLEVTQTANGVSAGHFNLREEEFLLGRFRVAKITVDAVEVEDMDRPERSRKQTIALKK